MIKNVKRAAVAAAAVGASVAVGMTLLTPVAQADTRIVLPKETQTARMGDGTVVTFTRLRERATINPSMGGTPLHRNAWISGKFSVRTSQKVDNIEINPGYIVACQVNLGGATGNLGDDALLNGIPGTGGQVELGPGQARAYYLTDWEHADDFAAEKHDTKTSTKDTNRANFGYTNQQLSLAGCGGYAQARSFATILVETEMASQQMSFYGRPFSLG
ncbi:MspA family porin [Gordonia sp. X0973]|nr:MspA family porin [Gordonia sp. X0973]